MKTDGVTYGLNIFFPRSQILHPADDTLQSAGELDLEAEGLHVEGHDSSDGNHRDGDIFSFSTPGRIVNDLEPWITSIAQHATPQTIMLDPEKGTPIQRGKIHVRGSAVLGIAHLRIIAEPDTVSTISLETNGHPAVIVVDLLLRDRSQLSLVSHISKGLTADARHAVIIRAILSKEAGLDLTTACFGSAYLFQRQAIMLQGEHAHATGRTIVLGGEHDRLDVATEMIHHAPNTRSSQQARTLLSDQAKAIVRGGIVIPEGRPGASADLESRALLLSPETEADLVPALVVGTDDVQCRHRASISSPNAEEMFYLRSRGIDHDTATQMVMTGFVSPLITSPGGTCVAPELETPLRERLIQMTQEEPYA